MPNCDLASASSSFYHQLMGVFLCWSGEGSRSHQIAEILKEWIPEILQMAETFLSAVDVNPGTLWMDRLEHALNSNSFGILCITPENRDNPWMHFEAGALWRTEQDRRVCPLLFDIGPAEITGPLSQLQSKRLDKQGLFEVMKEVNQYGASSKIDESKLNKAFERLWPEIKEKLENIKMPQKPLNLSKPKRETDDMVQEILTIVRSLHGKQAKQAPETWGPVERLQYETFERALTLLSARDPTPSFGQLHDVFRSIRHDPALLADALLKVYAETKQTSKTALSSDFTTPD
jgi:TIR domain